MKNNGTFRYSQLFRDDFEVEIPYEVDEAEIYLVVTAAPSVHHNYAWEPGWPKIYRYTWEIRVVGAFPEGYDPDPNAKYKTVHGSPHSNGGGFVAATATVAPSVYVGPKAVVVGNASVSGNARIVGAGVVTDNAVISGNAIIDGFAIVGGSARVSESAKIDEYARVYYGANISGAAVVKGSATVFHSTIGGQAQVKDNASMWGANLSGGIVVGGDAEHFGECGTGTYLQIWNLSNRGCDGLINHSLNSDINPSYTVFSDEEMGLSTGIDDLAGGLTRPYIISLDRRSGEVRVSLKDESEHIRQINVTDLTGRIIEIRRVGTAEREVVLRPKANSLVVLQIITTRGSYSEKILLPGI